jgi:Uma2 family endonuclease
MTVEEFQRLPENEAVDRELQYGKVVEVPKPPLRHLIIQHNLMDALQCAFGRRVRVLVNLSFCALPEYELRAADVGVVSRERWERADKDAYLKGAPDIVIEVISPSNTRSEMVERRKHCLENGTREFWEVFPKLREIHVSTPDGLTRTYKTGDSIPLTMAEGQSLSVDAVFADE